MCQATCQVFPYTSSHPILLTNTWSTFFILFIDEGQEKGTTEDEMAGRHHWLDGHESEWTPGVGDGQGGLACCDSWGRKESDTTEQLNWTELNWRILIKERLMNGYSFSGWRQWAGVEGTHGVRKFGYSSLWPQFGQVLFSFVTWECSICFTALKTCREGWKRCPV